MARHQSLLKLIQVWPIKVNTMLMIHLNTSQAKIITPINLLIKIRPTILSQSKRKNPFILQNRTAPTMLEL